MAAVKPNSTSFKKFFIQRDYSKGMGIRFQVKFPEELQKYLNTEKV